MFEENNNPPSSPLALRGDKRRMNNVAAGFSLRE
jgi:hypothetical protein